MRSVYRAILGIGLVTFSCLASGPLVKGAEPATTEDNKVLVLPFHALNSSEYQQWLGRSIQQSLAADLVSAAPGRVISSDAEAKDAAAATDIGKKEGARYVIFGSFATVDQTLRVTGEMVDVSSGKTVTGLKATGSVRDVFRLEDQLAGEVRQPLGLAPAAQPMPQVIYGPVTTPQSAPTDEYYQAYGQQQPSYYYSQPANYYYNYYGSPYDYGYGPYYGWGWGWPFWWGGAIFISSGSDHHHHHDDFHDHGHFDHASHFHSTTTGVGVGTLHAGAGAFQGGVSGFQGGVSGFQGGVSGFQGGASGFQGGVGTFHGGVGTFHGGVGTFHGGVGAFHGGMAPRMGGFHGGMGGGARMGGMGAAGGHR